MLYGYPRERRAQLSNVQVGHQGDSESVGEHQEGGYCIHYHSVRHGTASECKGGCWGHTEMGDTDRETEGQPDQTERQTVSGTLLLTTLTCRNNDTFGFQQLGQN